MLRRVGAVMLGLIATLYGLIAIDVLVTKITVLWGAPFLALLVFGSIAVTCGIGAQRLWRRDVREHLQSG